MCIFPWSVGLPNAPRALSQQTEHRRARCGCRAPAYEALRASRSPVGVSRPALGGADFTELTSSWRDTSRESRARCLLAATCQSRLRSMVNAKKTATQVRQPAQACVRTRGVLTGGGHRRGTFSNHDMPHTPLQPISRWAEPWSPASGRWSDGGWSVRVRGSRGDAAVPPCRGGASHESRALGRHGQALRGGLGLGLGCNQARTPIGGPGAP